MYIWRVLSAEIREKIVCKFRVCMWKLKKESSQNFVSRWFYLL